MSKEDEVKFIEQIESTARSSGITFDISSIDIDPNQEDSAFKEDLIVKMNVEGSWNSVISFINKLEKMPFGAVIKSVKLDAPDLGKWSGSVEFNIFREK